MRKLVVAAIATALVVAPAVARAQALNWKVDPNHSELTFRVRHFVSKVRGSFQRWDGTLVADPKDIAKGSVSVSVDTKSVFTNNEMRDNDLRSSNFFASDSFPTATFKSTKVEVKGSDVKIAGNLTLRGVTKPVVLTGSYNGVTKGLDGKPRIGFEASTKLNRLEYGLVWNKLVEGAAMLGDDVEISITVEAVGS